MSETVLDRLVARLRDALSYNANAFVEPVALLWPDESAQWKPVVRRVADRLPVVTLGEYNPTMRQGPAYLVRCVIARTVNARRVERSERRVVFRSRLSVVSPIDCQSLLWVSTTRPCGRDPPTGSAASSRGPLTQVCQMVLRSSTCLGCLATSCALSTPVRHGWRPSQSCNTAARSSLSRRASASGRSALF